MTDAWVIASDSEIKFTRLVGHVEIKADPPKPPEPYGWVCPGVSDWLLIVSVTREGAEAFARHQYAKSYGEPFPLYRDPPLSSEDTKELKLWREHFEAREAWLRAKPGTEDKIYKSVTMTNALVAAVECSRARKKEVK